VRPTPTSPSAKGKDFKWITPASFLHEERPVRHSETVLVERVRMTTEEHTDEETVRGQVRKEEIDTEGVDDPDGRRGM
jgi:stress response protein YsnF